jgi:hypothetical protein
MSEQIKVRKISPTTYMYMGIIVILGILGFLLAQGGKASKARAILDQLGYKNVANVKVFGVHKVEDMDTKIQGYKHFVTFTNQATNQECRGFIYKDFKRNVKQDITCK